MKMRQKWDKNNKYSEILQNINEMTEMFSKLNTSFI